MSEQVELKFEQALARLEEIVRQLEQGEARLDDALQLFEEGGLNWLVTAIRNSMKLKQD